MQESNKQHYYSINAEYHPCRQMQTSRVYSQPNSLPSNEGAESLNSDFTVKSSGNVIKTSCSYDYFYPHSQVVEASGSKPTSSYRAENADNFVFNSGVASPRKRTARSEITKVHYDKVDISEISSLGSPRSCKANVRTEEVYSMELHSPTVRKSQTVAHCNENQSISVSLHNVAQIQPVSMCKAKCSVITVNADRADYQENEIYSCYSEKRITLVMPSDDIRLIKTVTVQVSELAVDTVCYETGQHKENMIDFPCNSVAFPDYFTNRKNNHQLNRTMHGDALWSGSKVTISSDRCVFKWSDRLHAASMQWDPGIKGWKSHSDNILNMLTA